MLQTQPATARLTMTPIKWARYSDDAWMSELRLFGDTTMSAMESGVKLAVSAFSISVLTEYAVLASSCNGNPNAILGLRHERTNQRVTARRIWKLHVSAPFPVPENSRQ